jgi:CheY-like chemotaxis protein
LKKLIIDEGNPAPLVLVAEDDPQDSFLLRWAFEAARLKTRLHFVPDGAQAIDYLKGAPPFHNRSSTPFPDLLLLDLQMPCSDGFDVLKWLGQRPDLPPLSVVVFSGSKDPDALERAHALGADYYLFKPSGSRQLIRAVQHLNKHWLQGRPPKMVPAPSVSHNYRVERQEAR